MLENAFWGGWKSWKIWSVKNCLASILTGTVAKKTKPVDRYLIESFFPCVFSYVFTVSYKPPFWKNPVSQPVNFHITSGHSSGIKTLVP